MCIYIWKFCSGRQIQIFGLKFYVYLYMEVLFWVTNSDFVQCIQLFSAIHSDFVAHNSSRSGLSAFSKFKIE